MEKQINLTNSQPKLFSIYHCDGNDRQETYRFKAYDINDVVQYIKKNFFEFDEKFTESDLYVDWQDEDLVYIIWDNCGGCESVNVDVDSCDVCVWSQSSFEISEITEPEESDFQFITVEGTNNYVDLTCGSKNR